jgi:hypothetical protein
MEAPELGIITVLPKHTLVWLSFEPDRALGMWTLVMPSLCFFKFMAELLDLIGACCWQSFSSRDT